MSGQPLREVEVLISSSETESEVGVTQESAPAAKKLSLLEESIVNPPPAIGQGDSGKEDDTFQVSHLASIEINQVTRSPPPRAGMRRKPSRLRTMEPSSSSVPSSPLLDHQKKEEQEEEVKEMSEQDETTPGSDVVHSDAQPEIPIEKSPYEAEFDAEEGEKIFLDMKDILTQDTNSRPKESAVKLFGSLLAAHLIRAAALIELSGMAYSQDWIRGNFRDTVVGKIPTDLLLLCLVSSRFVKAGDLVLSGICKELDLFSHVNNAIDEWGLEEDFKLVSLVFSVKMLNIPINQAFLTDWASFLHFMLF
jgi:hypothetical protein